MAGYVVQFFLSKSHTDYQSKFIFFIVFCLCVFTGGAA